MFTRVFLMHGRSVLLPVQTRSDGGLIFRRIKDKANMDTTAIKVQESQTVKNRRADATFFILFVP